MRVIAGTLKGRRLSSPDWPGLRPTSDKLRETLFNVLGTTVQGARVLDGFAGTGAVGIEALSRGAAHVTFVERDRKAAGLVESNLQHCGLKEGYAIIRVDFAAAGPRLAGTRFDIIFLDPPYGPDEVIPALTVASKLSAPGTRVIIEHAKRNPAPSQTEGLVLTRQLTSGDSALSFYRTSESIPTS